ncbi:hypothetical protein AOC19_02995 [Polynucleobacter asymbioticus]|uniref:hypothetical protein n=1 Tax=Polynucleobacter asymbioticus TaxID=576611 RepID=UPI001BFCECD6|nr:hypothetical protein [Polynucleobacter asymbioticus]QWD85853.1 hypothetical protein AOC19_02995 [Polynucleobacter asymbioticus]
MMQKLLLVLGLVASLGMLATSAYAQPSMSAGASPSVNRPEVSRQLAPSMPSPSGSMGSPQPAAGATSGEGVAKPSIVAPSLGEINGRIPPLPPLPPTSTPAVKLVNPRTGEVASEIKASGEGKGAIKAAAAGASGSQANARPPLSDSQAGNSGVSLSDKKDIQSVGSTQSKSQGMLSRPAYIIPMTPGKVVFSIAGADGLFHGPGVLHSNNEVGASAPSQEKIQQRQEKVVQLQQERGVVQEERALIEQKRAPIEQKRAPREQHREEKKEEIEWNMQMYGRPFDIDIFTTWAVCIHPPGPIDWDTLYHDQ